MTRWLNSLQPWGVVLLRLVLGVAMLASGWEKVYSPNILHGHNTLAALDHYCHYIASLGLPYWLGYISAFTEVVGGLCLLIGLFVRFFSFLVAGNMLTAIVMVNRHHGYSGSAYSIALLAIATMLLLAGPGRLALDRRMGLI
ncbi:DoxX family protein [Granulicella arctica]|uniref:DoxX family protein n=1 Tax=Granulicella arctica TaxID=940613 RepID=UPI0021E04765|nr:DoxX family protein [Granulicella arctica]